MSDQRNGSTNFVTRDIGSIPEIFQEWNRGGALFGGGQGEQIPAKSNSFQVYSSVGIENDPR
ncbi:hypothetical protein XCR1_1710007 [Xenorhabdus cabanillasii JM26]|uniref:Uncharacterized protein n=1 Tax=Xenorhabdus cabanillasii JM26 TaxID=1427517 RepID=W1IW57_9GAMM|nr:hypothetical protein XCR1_1710007 [Xenorhabdus cabanillasii JM26]